jgi:hypothetical protein
LGPQRGSSFRPTWRTIERTSEESRGRNGVTGRRQRVPGAPEGNTGRRDRPRTEGAGRHKRQNKLGHSNQPIWIRPRQDCQYISD